MSNLNIISVAAEVAPLSKTGVLGDVARSLPKSLQRLGENVSIVTPFYKEVIDTKKFKVKEIFSDIPLIVDEKNQVKVNFYQTELVNNLPVYLVSADRYFGRRKELYGSRLENARFYIFDLAVLELLKLLNSPVDIIHCHDWHSGLIPELLKKRYKADPLLGRVATVFTAHNLTFQFGHNWWEVPGKKRDSGRKALPLLNNETELERINFTKRAFLYADAINTVSETYAEEILKPNFGQDLHRILQNRKAKLFGVVNGIDYLEFNPSKDKDLAVNYDYKKLHRKKVNKQALQKLYKLPVMPTILTKPLQFIVIGDGDKDYIKQFTALEQDFPDSFRARPFADKKNVETLLYAGADLILLPSRFEPCGTAQLKGLRYGCVPVVREVGGLGETVSNFDPQTNPQGIGFVFRTYNSYSLMMALTRALETIKYKIVW